jgi:DNA (cytosine-5)-methyltransferase 1
MAGWEPAAALDVDLDAARTYRTNHPGVPCVVKDIRRVPATEIADTAGVRPGELDALIGGVPCEGYSLLNRRYDASDPRNHLFLEFLRIARLLRPKLLLIENVPGMRRRANGGFARAVLESFEALGYRASAHELDALGYGVPQQRLRLFFVGVREDLGTRFSPPGPTAERGLTLREAISDLPPVRPGEKATRYGGHPCASTRERPGPDARPCRTTWRRGTRSGRSRGLPQPSPGSPCTAPSSNGSGSPGTARRRQSLPAA